MRGRKAFLITNIVIVSASLLTALRVMPGPELLGMILAFYALFILPGILIRSLLFGPPAVSVRGICMTFGTGFVFVSLVVLLGLIPGVSYGGIAAVAAVADIVLLLVNYLGRPWGGSASGGGGPERGGEGVGKLLLLVLVFTACFVFFYGSGDLRWSTDSLDHLSFVRRALDGGDIFPGDSYYGEGDGASFDPRKGLWHPVLSLWAYQSEVPLEVFWRILPSFLAFFIITSFFFFARELIDSVPLAALATVLLLLFFRVEGIEWFTKAGFSSSIAQTLLWIDSALLIRYFKSKRRIYLVDIFLITLIGSAVHAVFTLLIAVVLTGFFLYVTFLASGVKWRRAYWIATAAIAGAVAAPLAARLHYTSGPYNMIHTHRQGMLLFTDKLAMVDPVEIAVRVGLCFFFAVLLLPFFFRIAGGVGRRTLVGILFLFPAVLVLNPWTGGILERRLGYMQLRILYAAPLMCFLSMGVAGLLHVVLLGAPPGGGANSGGVVPGAAGRASAQAGSPKIAGGKERAKRSRGAAIASNLSMRLAAALAIALFVYYPGRAAMYNFVPSVKGIIRGTGGIGGRYEALFEYLDNGLRSHSVVVSDPRTSYIISAFSDQFVAVTLDQHCSPTDTLALERLGAVRDLFNPSVPVTASVEFLKENEADYVLIDTRLEEIADFFGTAVDGIPALAAEKLASCPEIFRELHSVGGFTVFEVVSGGAAEEPSKPCGEASARPLPCLAPGLRPNDLEAGMYRSTPPEPPEDRSTAPAERPPGGVEGPAPAEARDVGCGLLLEGLELDRSVLEAGDTVSGSFCWLPVERVEFGLPLGWIVRLDTEFPKGSFYRPWYGKQYRRVVERRSWTFYRYAGSGHVHSGFTYPDHWEAGAVVRQDFSIPLSRWLSPGLYEFRLKVRRVPYISNRRITDYFRNEDSMQGELVAAIRVLPRNRAQAPVRR